MDLAGPHWEPPRPWASFTSLNHVRSHQRRCQLLSRPPHSWKNTQSCTHANTNTRTQKSYIDFCSQTQTTLKKCLCEVLSLNLNLSPPLSCIPCGPISQQPLREHTDTHSIPVLNMVMRREARLVAESFAMLRMIGSPFPEDFATNTLGYRPPIAFYSSLSCSLHHHHMWPSSAQCLSITALSITLSL